MLLVIVKDESDKMIDGRFHAHALHFYKTISRTRRSGTVAPPRSRAIYHASTRLKSNAPNEKTSSLLLLLFHRDSKSADIPISVTNEDAAISIRRPASSNSKEIRRIHSFCMLLLFLASRGSVWFLEPPFYAWLTQRRNDFFRIELCEADICARKYFISAIDFYSRCSLLEKSPREKDEGFGRMILPHSFRWPDLGH